MNAAARLFVALERKMPDRVPVVGLSIDPAIARKLGYRSYVELFDQPFLDAVLVNLLADFPEGSNLAIPTGKTYQNPWGITMRYTHEVTPQGLMTPSRSRKTCCMSSRRTRLSATNTCYFTSAGRSTRVRLRAISLPPRTIFTCTVSPGL